MITHDLIKKIKNGMYDETLKDVYVDEKKISYERERYIKAIESYTEHFGEGEIFVFSAPGRSEIGGNHTDHQCGEVLAASINNDAIAVVHNLEEPCVRVISAGYEMITIYLDDLGMREDEKATTNALIRGVLAKTKEYGFTIWVECEKCNARIDGFCPSIENENKSIENIENCKNKAIELWNRRV